MKTVFIQPERCIGCRHCEIACAVEHSPGKNLLGMLEEIPRSRPRIYVETGPNFLTFPNRCRHCDPAPCMQVCPTYALYRDEATGSVLINYEKCINCEVCSIACPFGIIEFHNVFQVQFSHDVNAKCDNCIDRQKAEQIPACVEACKTDALLYGDINDLMKNSRKDFTIRLLKSQSAESDIPDIPAEISAYRNIMEKVADIGPFKEN